MAYTKIMGNTKATRAQMSKYIKKRNPNVPNIVIEKIIPAFIAESAIQGVRGDIAFAQSCEQTGNFGFKGSAVTLSQNNFAGIGVTKNGMKGNSFPDVNTGVRAQIQHLKAYASKEPLKQKCVDPRFKYVERGCIPYIDILGIQENPKRQGWSAGKNYGPNILKILSNILAIEVTKEEQAKYSSTIVNTTPPLNKTKKYIGKVTADYLNVRTWAGMENPTVSFGPLKKNTKIDICDQKLDTNKNKWYYISYGGKYGFVSASYVELIVEHSTKEQKTDYLAAAAKWAPVVYKKIVQLKCAHKVGAKSFNDIIEKKITTCSTSASAVLQQAGCLEFGKKISHTKAVWGSSDNILKKKNTIDKAMNGKKYLIPNTYDIVKIGVNYKKIDNKYKKAGIVYIQDSNVCVNAGGDQIWSTNQGGAQYKNGHYFNTLNKSGYPFNSIILYAIVPRNQ